MKEQKPVGKNTKPTPEEIQLSDEELQAKTVKCLMWVNKQISESTDIDTLTDCINTLNVVQESMMNWLNAKRLGK